MFGVVYKITNIVNNKVYIGQTKDFKRRKWEHTHMFAKGVHENILIQNDLATYGKSVFVFDVLEECNTREQLLDRETFYINQYGGIDSNNTYNMQDRFNANAIMRELNSAGQIGKTLSDEHKSKISKSEKEYYRNPEHIPVFKGRHHTQETKHKLSELHKGTHLSEETKLKISIGNKNKAVSTETREKMRVAQLGKRKYSNDLIKLLRTEYADLKSYRKVYDRHKDINYYSIINLIKYGTPNAPVKYK